MSAPQGPRGRSTSRGRGNPRGGVTPRDLRITRGEKANSQRPVNNVTRGTDSLKPPPSQGHVRTNSSKKSAPLNAAVQSHAGKIPNLRKEAWRNPAATDSRIYKERMNDLYQTLKQKRERERKAAIKDGFLADPDRPTSLANAITPVGTCQEKCPEFERVERIVQLMVDGNEKKPSSTDSDVNVPCEELMVKRFRRSAAGYDEQLPSDIRPPPVLKKTLDYLFNTVIGGPEPLADVHKFVWDRTRGIRNDFSIQQVTKMEDLKIAIDCFERVARFHILSLHQLTRVSSDAGEFDHHQEREQLNNTLLSLMYYYDDSRHKLTSPNEAEFRAYCIVFEIQDQRPDLEDRAQIWPRSILKDQRVQTAIKLYAAAGNTSDEQGPLRPRTQFLTAQANAGGFWRLVQSNAVSYMLACVAEIYFNLVRRTALEAIWKAYKGKRGGPTKMEDWTVKDLTFALGFDTEYQTQTFCGEHDFELGEREDGELYVDLGSVASGNLTDQNPRRKQIFSKSLVESKRLGRTLPAIINGLSAAQAQSRGYIEDSSDADTASMADSESLFINGDSDEEDISRLSRSGSPQNGKGVNGDAPKLNATATPFNPFAPTNLDAPGKSSFPPPTTFGRPGSTASTTKNPSSPTPTFDFNSKPATQEGSGSREIPKFDFRAAINAKKGEDSKESSQNLNKSGPTTFNFFPSTAKVADTNNNKNQSPFVTAPAAGKSTFGQPSTALDGSKLSEPTKSPFGPPSSLPATITSPQPKSIFDHSPNTSAQPNSSFSTSPLFDFGGPKRSDQGEHTINPGPSQESKGKSPETVPLKPKDDIFKPPVFSASTTSTGLTPSLFARKPQPTEPAVPKQTRSSKPLTAPFPSFPTAATLTATPTTKPQGTSNPLQSTSSFPKAKDTNILSPQPPPFSSTNQSQLPTQQNPQGSDILAPSNAKPIGNAPIQPREDSLIPKQPQPNPGSLLLDKLAGAMMLDDHGLLQQFIEFTVGPIITSSIAQLEDEESWAEARECRAILLGKKYFERWRANAWNLGLMRKGRGRRRNFARLVQESARSPRRRSSELSSFFTSSGSGPASPLLAQQNFANTMLPPAQPANKRQSLPTDLDTQQTQLEATTATKRKRDDTVTNDDEVSPRRTNISHRRSQTLGGSIMSAPPHRRPSFKTYEPRMDVSKVAEGSMLHDTLMKQARRLVPNVKSDTTSTDYFRLKALGIEPDTPFIPLTKKRTWTEVEGPESGTASKSWPRRGSPMHTMNQPNLYSNTQNPATPSKTPSAAADDDEALFTQIRSVREALAESEEWMHSERQSIESSITPQPSVSPSSNETPAQRRLREIKERGHTPSRSEIRLRAMGDKALLPKRFWDGEGMGKSLSVNGKQKDTEIATPNSFSQPPPQRVFGLTGFATMGGQGQMNGFNGGGNAEKKGATVKDAIEL